MMTYGVGVNVKDSDANIQNIRVVAYSAQFVNNIFNFKIKLSGSLPFTDKFTR